MSANHPTDIRLIAVDLDGTLLNSRKQISAEDRDALAEAAARGITIVPTTGRNYSFALPVLESLGFPTTMVCSNGAIIRTSSGQTHFQRLLPRTLAHEILVASQAFHQFAVLMYDHDGLAPDFAPLQMLPAPDSFAVAHDYDAPGAIAHPPLRSIADSAWARKNHRLISQVEKLMITEDTDPLEILYAGPVDAMRELLEALRREFVGKAFEDAAAPDDSYVHAFSMMRTEYPAQNFSMLDVIHARCSKGTALAQLGRQLGIAAQQIMAIGDNFNDLDMLEFAGLPVVMGNASREFLDDTVTRRGWRLTRDCDSHGVAGAIREHVLTDRN
jgi:HAD superfamily hydrolase (TIGR01484 family)